jgi:hypothetical protein
VVHSAAKHSAVKHGVMMPVGPGGRGAGIEGESWGRCCRANHERNTESTTAFGGV